MSFSLPEAKAIVHCEDCGIHERVWFSGIAAEIRPSEARELLDVLFHGVRATHFVEVGPIQGVKAPHCVGKVTIFFSAQTLLLDDPFRDDPYWSLN